MKIKMYRSCDSEKFVKIEIVLLVHAVLTENLASGDNYIPTVIGISVSIGAIALGLTTAVCLITFRRRSSEKESLESPSDEVKRSEIAGEIDAVDSAGVHIEVYTRL